MRWYKRKFQICNVRENLSRKQWTAEMSMEPSRRTTERVTSNCAVSCADTAPKYVDDSICLWEEQQEEDIDTENSIRQHGCRNLSSRPLSDAGSVMLRPPKRLPIQ